MLLQLIKLLVQAPCLVISRRNLLQLGKLLFTQLLLPMQQLVGICKLLGQCLHNLIGIVLLLREYLLQHRALARAKLFLHLLQLIAPNVKQLGASLLLLLALLIQDFGYNLIQPCLEQTTQNFLLVLCLRGQELAEFALRQHDNLAELLFR